MNRDRVPGWIGWPSRLPAPGSTWVPGPYLRFGIRSLVFAFLALSLTVNYAASVTFFLLAILGIYVGLRRGFLNGLSRVEKGFILIFLAYPALAILSYVLGAHTVVGFRVLGRELRFFLVVPLYLSLRWAAPKGHHVGMAAASGAVIACVASAIQWRHTTSANLVIGLHLVSGTASSHITFGALALLFGTMGALLVTSAGKNKRAYYVIGAMGMAAGIISAVLSLSRTAWLAFPALLLILAMWLWKKKVNKTYLAAAMALIMTGALLGFLFQPVLRNRIASATNVIKYSLSSTSWPLPAGRCPNGRASLARYSRAIGQPQYQSDAAIRVRRSGKLPAVWSKICHGGSEIVLKSGLERNYYVFMLPRVGFSGQPQSYDVLAKGQGRLWLWRPVQHSSISSGTYVYTHAESRSRNAGTLAMFAVPRGKEIAFIPLQSPSTFGGYSLSFYKNSIAERIGMWRFSLQLFKTSPWIGHGVGSFRKLAEEYSERGDSTAVISRKFEHPHSGYLNNLYGGGIVLLLVFLGILAAPYLATRSLAALTLSLFMAFFCLTESMFMHSFVISCYLVLCILVLVEHEISPLSQNDLKSHA